ncbi:MAG: hypothetical protein FWD73_10845 [Polyangiaceae bacterium]|nr:hypothetical protein [Polyangiaceae bacterium]
MSSIVRLSAAVVALAALLLAACGGSVPGAPKARAAQASASSESAGAESAGASSEGRPSAGGTSGPVPLLPMKAIMASTMADDLKKIGLDVQNLPPLRKLEPEKLRLVMKTFSKALGTKCTGCHDEDDYRAPTPNAKITSKMWDIYVRGFAQTDGSALYCDSCHDGKMKFLDRHDRHSLAGWMCENYTEKLRRVDKQENSCESCHGDPYKARFLSTWAM